MTSKTPSSPPPPRCLSVSNLPISTLAIAGANCVLYAILLCDHSSVDFMDRLISYGANFAPRTANGQAWRLLTSIFLHGSGIHLLMNVWVLLLVGRVAEHVLGRAVFICGYLATGVIGSLAGVFFHPHAVSVGASGAILGAFGMLLGYLIGCHDTRLKRQLGSFCGFCLGVFLLDAFFTWGSNTDQAAHFGGLAAGVVIGWTVGLSRAVNSLLARKIQLTLMLAVFVTITAGVVFMPAGFVDLRQEVAELAVCDSQIESMYQALAGRIRARQATLADIDSLIQHELLPMWRAASKRLLESKNVPACRRDCVTVMKQYIELREESWQLLSESVATGNHEKALQARSKHKAADTLLRELCMDSAHLSREIPRIASSLR